MNEDEQSKVIRMVWEDRATFDEIQKCTGLVESEVIKLIGKSLKPWGFKMWRERVSGRITKQGRRFEQSRKELRKIPQQQLQGE